MAREKQFFWKRKISWQRIVKGLPGTLVVEQTLETDEEGGVRWVGGIQELARKNRL